MGKKRDRWDSSSEDDEEKEKTSSKSGIAKKKAPISKEKAPSTNISQVQQQQQQNNHSFPLHNPLLQGCRSVYDTYERIAHVSEGTYGVVYKARDLATHEIVALKQIKFGVDERVGTNTEGFPVTALREISVLLALSSHESIVSVKEMVVGDAPDKVFMVMEFFEFDLSDGLSRFEGALAQSELKGILQQILAGVDHMHSKWYLHRDLKPSNCLVQQKSGRVALADFGLARRYEDPPRAMTQLVVTLWYRSPELLFGESRYGPPVDMWSVGCMFGELICKEAILQGQGELDQIDQIFSLLGIPDEDSWPSFQKLPNAGLFRWKPKSKEEILLPKKFPVAKPVSANQAFLDSAGFDLLSGLLTLDPSKRLTSEQALNHAYFREGVAPKRPHFFSS